MSEPNLHEVVLAVIADSDGGDTVELTTAVFDKIGCPDEWRPWFFQLVHDEVRRRVRGLIRSRARRSSATVTPLLVGLPNRKASHPSAITRPQFLRDTIETFGSWGRVAFGDMTVEMHESRIAGQLKLAAGVKRDIDRHQDAIQRIKAAGVAKLNDLPEYGGKGVA